MDGDLRLLTLDDAELDASADLALLIAEVANGAGRPSVRSLFTRLAIVLHEERARREALYHSAES